MLLIVKEKPHLAVTVPHSGACSENIISCSRRSERAGPTDGVLLAVDRRHDRRLFHVRVVIEAWLGALELRLPSKVGIVVVLGQESMAIAIRRSERIGRNDCTHCRCVRGAESKLYFIAGELLLNPFERRDLPRRDAVVVAQQTHRIVRRGSDDGDGVH